MIQVSARTWHHISGANRERITPQDPAHSLQRSSFLARVDGFGCFFGAYDPLNPKPYNPKPQTLAKKQKDDQAITEATTAGFEMNRSWAVGPQLKDPQTRNPKRPKTRNPKRPKPQKKPKTRSPKRLKTPKPHRLRLQRYIVYRERPGTL